MSRDGAQTVRQEWASMWLLPIIGMLGYAGSAAFAFSSGVFMVELTREFGWSRAEFSYAFVVQMLLGLVIMPFVGRFVDLVGPRRIALAGIVPFAVGFSLLALVNGTLWQWLALSALLALLTAFIGPAIWVKAVVSRFTASRGIALAVVLAGSGVGATVWPILGAFYIQWLGWRMAYPAMALSWALVILPLTYFFFFGSKASPLEHASISAGSTASVNLWHVFFSSSFLRLAIAGGAFSAFTYGLTLNLVPILQGHGLSLTKAAAIAGLAGIFAILGRIGTGLLLDLLPTRPLAVCIFLVPIFVAALLWNVGSIFWIPALAIALLGFVSGADGDIVAYLISRRFEPDNFATVYAPMVAILSASASFGPLLAGYCYDVRGAYDLYLLALVPLSLLAATLIGSVAPASPARPG